MIGTALLEDLVQSVAISHLIKGHRRVSLLLLAAPESGKTTITSAASCKHVCRIAVITGRSILRELRDRPTTEFLLFNDLTAVRAMSHQASALLVVLLNQLTQGERGQVAFAGKESEEITRSVGVIACIPFTTFSDHRSRWREMGFVSRMIPFAYAYPHDLVATIKDSIDNGSHPTMRPIAMPKRLPVKPQTITVHRAHSRQIRHLADARAAGLEQLGIRLLQNYHCLVRAHALLHKRAEVTDNDLWFLRAVDRHVSITRCEPLEWTPTAVAR